MTRDFRITVLANQKEYEALLEASEAAGMPVSTYIRMAALEMARKEQNG